MNNSDTCARGRRIEVQYEVFEQKFARSFVDSHSLDSTYVKISDLLFSLYAMLYIISIITV